MTLARLDTDVAAHPGAARRAEARAASISASEQRGVCARSCCEAGQSTGTLCEEDEWTN